MTLLYLPPPHAMQAATLYSFSTAHAIVNHPPSRNAIDAFDPRWAHGAFPKNDGSPGCTEDFAWNGVSAPPPCHYPPPCEVASECM